MDKTFEDIIMEVAGELNSTDTPESEETTTEETEAEENVESDESIDTEETEAEETEEVEDDTNVEDLDEDDRDSQNPSMNEKDVQAFINLRQENKKNKDALNYLDTRAKAMGLSGIDELIEKAKEAELKQNAEKEGIPVEIMKKINDLEARVSQYDVEKQQAAEQRENERLSRTFEIFIQNNNLDKKAIDDLANNLVNDGIDLNTLKGLPNNAINRMLGSYISKEDLRQKELAKKEKIKKEVPINSNNQVSQDDTNKIDELAKLWAGK